MDAFVEITVSLRADSVRLLDRMCTDGRTRRETIQLAIDVLTGLIPQSSSRVGSFEVRIPPGTTMKDLDAAYMASKAVRNVK